MTTLPDTAALIGHLGEKTAFSRGNHALRTRDYSKALENYLAAPIDNDVLRSLVGLNGVLARRARRREQARASGTRVAICGWNMSQPNPRVVELAALYESSSDVEIIGSIFARKGASTDMWPGFTGITVPVKSFLVGDPAKFIDAAQAFALANPCDLIHLSKPMASNILLGLVYRLLWDTRVVVDIDEDDLVGLRQPKPVSMEGYLRKRATLPGIDQLLGEDWTRLAFGLADDFDGLTVATDSLRKQFGGFVISGDTKLRRASALRLRQQATALVKRSGSVSSDAVRVMELVPEGRRLHAFGVLLDINTARFDQAPPASAPRARAAIATPKTLRIVAQADAAPPSELAEFEPLVAVEPQWIRAADFDAQAAGAPVLGLAGLPLGLWPADETALPDLTPLAAFCRLYGLEPTAAVQLHAAGAAPAALADDRFAGGRFGPDLAAVGIADAWYTTDATLRVRIERPAAPGIDEVAKKLPDSDQEVGAEAAADERPSFVVRCYQLDLETLAPRLAGEAIVYSDEPVFADVALADPLSPVLLTRTDASGSIQAVSVLPFPSLCRGGWHHGELAALGSHGEYMSNLQDSSAALLAEYLETGEARQPLSVGHLAIDLQGATGAEKIFAPALLGWLRKVFAIQWQAMPDESGSVDAKAAEYLLSALALPEEAADSSADARVAARAAGPWTLQLPADSLPSIAALVSRRLAPPASAAAMVGSYVLAHPTTGKPLSVVTLPALGADLLALQPRGLPFGFPVLRGDAPATEAASPLGVESQAPLALSYREPARSRPASLLSPLSPDLPASLLRRDLSDDERAQASVSVVLGVRSVDDELATFLEALSRQTLAGAIDVVVAAGPSLGDGRPMLDNLLASSFPGRHSVVETSETDAYAQLRAAAGIARGRRMLVADTACVMQDPRTLETLYLLALDDRVATASCIVLREETFKKGSEVRFHSGGFYPSHLSLLAAPHLVFTEPYTLNAFPAATYPVVGNSFRLALVNTAAWAELGGIATGPFAHHRPDLDFCIRAQLAGYRHLCTAAVSASVLRAGRTEQFVDGHALRQLAPGRWPELLAGVTLLHEVGG